MPTQFVSLPELAAAAPLDHIEAVTLVREVAHRVARDELPGIPSAHVIRLSGSGALSVEGPIAADGSPVRRAAHLLDTLLPPFDSGLRVPGALRLVVARALGTLDLPPYPCLESFTDALSRFAAPDAPECFRQIVADRPQTPPVEVVLEPTPARDSSITVSDIRRARRATGVSLAEISRQCGVPIHLFRELEWGYFDNWPGPHTARRWIAGYAKTAGLDERLVVRTLWPLIGESVRSRGELAPLDALPVPVTVELVREPEESVALAPAALPYIEPAPSRRWGPRRLVAALTIAALFALGIAPALWQHSAAHRSPDTATAADRALTPAVASPDVNVAVRNGAVEPSNAGPVDDQSTEPDARPASLADPVTYSPAFASAGTAMFYHAEAKGHTKLMRADTNRRGDVLRITSVLDDRGRNYHPRPSPDGKQIAFDSDRDGVRGVYVADANGRNVRRVSGSGYAAIPSWSADGRRLAFVRAEEGKPKVWNLWTLDLRSGRSERLTSYKYGQPWGGSWFPDNRRLAYSHETELVILDLGTGRKRVFQSPVKGRLVRTPAVSPDGSHVVFQVYRRGTWLLDMNTGKMRKVLGDPTAEEYAWAPDGRKVAYHSRGGGNWGIWVLNKVGVKIVNTEQ